MLFSTTDTLQGYTIEEYLGPVYAGSVFPEKGLKKNGAWARFNQNWWMEKLFEGLEAHAKEQHANAVIAIRFMVGKEDHVFAVGTAIKVSPEPPEDAGFHLYAVGWPGDSDTEQDERDYSRWRGGKAQMRRAAEAAQNAIPMQNADDAQDNK